MPNAWDRVGTPSSRRTASRALIAVGTILLLVAAISVVSYRNLLDTDTFATNVDQVRQQPAVSQALGEELAAQVIQAQPDLVAIKPVIEQGAAFVVGSDVLSPLVRQAAAQAQQAATDPDEPSIVLRVADAGAVVTSVLKNLAPDLLEDVPADLSLTLAEVGSGSLFEQSIRAARYLSLAAWVLPVLALGCIVLGVWIAPNQRRGMVRAGIASMVAGGVLGLLTLLAGIVLASLGTDSLTGAVANGAWEVFGDPFWVATAVLVITGALVAAAAAALLPDIDVDEVLRAASQRVRQRPASTELAALRGLAVIALGVGLLIDPIRLLTWAGVLVGLLVLAYGVSEITVAAVGAKAGEPAAAGGGAREPEPESGAGRWILGTVVSIVVIGLLAGAFVVVRDVDTDATAAAVVTGDAATCNGFEVLCERRYDEVSFATTHNAMSAADQPGWFLAEQPHSVLDQLDGGARALMIDVWEARPAGEYVSSLSVNLTEGRADLEESYPPEAIDSALRVVEAAIGEPTGPPALYMCHGLCEIGATELAPTLQGIGSWMNANPNEVVTLLVENHVEAADIAQAIVDAGLAPIVHDPSSGFPTLRDMILTGKRLVVMTEDGEGGAQAPWLDNMFALTQDTPYTFPKKADLSCEANRGGPDAPLFLVNHWLSGFSNLVSAAKQINPEDVLGPRVEQCQEERGMLPNFVGVNYYSIGDLLPVVNELNGVA